MNSDVSPKIYVPLLLFVGGLLACAVLFRVAITDWWFFVHYQPDQRISALSDDAGFTDLGERLFLRTNPEIVPQSVLDAECENIESLGCIIEGPKTYIRTFDSVGSEYDQAVVTAAHEMLHLAYFRLSDDEKTEVNRLLNTQFTQLRDPDVLRRINSYDQDERLDEMHSIMATEVPVLNSQLEQHYADYFEDQRTEIRQAYDNSRHLLN